MEMHGPYRNESEYIDIQSDKMILKEGSSCLIIKSDTNLQMKN